MRKMLILLTILIVASISVAGNLNPSAAPGSTMKTLGELQPRIPLAQADFPKTINESGSYYLTGNIHISSSSSAITIAADDVSVDLMGFTVSGSNTGLGDGITLAANKNIKITNGTIKTFGRCGVSSHNDVTQDVSLINLEIRDNNEGALFIRGDGHVIESCRITGNGEGGLGFNAIYVESNARIINNIIAYNGANVSTSGGYGICIKAKNACLVKGNIIRGNFSSSQVYRLRAIWVEDGCIVADNIIAENFGSSTEVTQSTKCLYGEKSCMVYRNAIRNNGSSIDSTDFYGIEFGDGSVIRENSICNNAGSATLSGTLYGLKATNSVMKNNVITNNGELPQGLGNKYGLYTGYYGVLKNNVITYHTGSSAQNLYNGSGCVVEDNVAP